MYSEVKICEPDGLSTSKSISLTSPYLAPAWSFTGGVGGYKEGVGILLMAKNQL
jgi:hypothetical protein